MSVLFRDAQPMLLRDSSPLVRSLEDVEGRRTKLFAFYFLNHPVDRNGWGRDHVQVSRAQLIGDFIEVFPNFVRTFWPDEIMAGLLAKGGDDL